MNQGQCKWRTPAGAFICILMVMTALLLWGRLKLVTGVPRTALADPDAAQVDEPGHDGPAGLHKRLP
jgi:hypothetical protein